MGKINQHGFGIIGVIVAVIVLAAIGFAGYMAFSNDDDIETSQQPVSEQDTTQKEQAVTNESDAEEAEGLNTKTFVSSDKKLEVAIPDGWTQRACRDHTGVAMLVTAGDSQEEVCSDGSTATWLTANGALYAGKVVVGTGSNPYPRYDNSAGEPKDLYNDDAEKITLSDGREVLKFTYVYDSKQPNTKANVIEYTFADESASAFIFDGYDVANLYETDLSIEQVVRIVEEIILPSIKVN